MPALRARSSGTSSGHALDGHFSARGRSGALRNRLRHSFDVAVGRVVEYEDFCHGVYLLGRAAQLRVAISAARAPILLALMDHEWRGGYCFDGEHRRANPRNLELALLCAVVDTTTTSHRGFPTFPYSSGRRRSRL